MPSLAPMLIVGFFASLFMPINTASANAATPISLITTGSASHISDMSFLASRSQTKPLTKSGVGPYTMTHTNANPSLSYSYPTDANYGGGHSGCSSPCLPQLNESDVRNPNGMNFSFSGVTTTTATLISEGNIVTTPTGSTRSNTTASGTVSYGSVFGPEVWSVPFLATTGQSVSFEWKASGGGDDYEVYGFLVKVTNPGTCSASTDYGGSTQAEKTASHTVVAHGRGKTANTFNTASGTVPADGCYRFRFVNGTYDASGGYYVGATFYIQNPYLGLAHNITFTQLEDRVVQSANYTVSLAATTNAGATVTFAIHAGLNTVCTLSGSTLTVRANTPGQCTVRADAGATGNYSAAPTSYMSFNVLAAATAPVYSGGASISGSALVCSTLTANEGTWANGGSAYTGSTIQWFSNGVAIAGATASTYTLTADDVGDSITFTVTKTNSVGSRTSPPSTGLLVVDARLTGLTLSSGTLSPSFATCASSYTLTSTQSTITVTPTISAAADSIEVNGSAVQSGQPTNPLSLTPGTNTVTLTVKSGIFSRNIAVTVSYLAPPTVTALTPVLTSGTQAQLQASINANGFATSSITFSLVESGNQTPTFTQGALSSASVSGTTATTVTQDVTGLTSGATYTFTAEAVNANGTTTSTSITFQTPDAPAVTTGNASSVTATSATLAGTVNGFNRSTTVQLVYSTNANLSGATTVNLANISQADAATTQNVSQAISQLTTGTRYYYQFRAANFVGENSGDIKSFVTVAAPTVTHGTHQIAERSAELFATINANGADTSQDIKFIWSTTSNFATSTEVVATPARASAGADRVISVNLTGLTPGTNYWFKVTATNSAGTTTSVAEQFTTTADPLPTVVLQAASSVNTGASISLTVRFSEVVTGFQASDLSISGTPAYTAGNPQDLGSGVYSVVLTTTSSSTGTVTIGLPGARVKDAGNQDNTAATNITVSVVAPMTTPTITLSYASATVPVAATPTLNKGGSSGGATYSLLSYTAGDAAPNCVVNASTGAVTVTGEGKCKVGVSVAATATHYAASTDAFVTFTKSTGTIVWNTASGAVTIRSTAGTTRTTTLVGPNGSGIYTLEIKLGETVKIPFNSPNSEPVGYSSYFKCPSVIGWDQSTMFPMDGSGNSFYYLNAKQIGSCNVSNGQASANYLSLPSAEYTTPLSPGILVTVVKGDQNPISVVGNSSANFGEAVVLDATGGSGTGARTFSVTGTGCTIQNIPFSFNGVLYPSLNTAELTKSGAGTCSVTVTKAGDTRYESATSDPFVVTFGKGSQEITFTSNVPAVPSSGDVYTPVATASSSLTVSFALSGPCSYNAQTGQVSFTGAGSCVVTASQAGNSNYDAAANATQTIVVGERNQTITFDAIADKEYGDAAFVVSATSSVTSMIVTITSATTSVCTIDSVGVVVLKTAGICTLHADQAGQVGTVAAASRVTRSFEVFPAGSSAPFITSVSRGLGSLTATLIPPSYTGGETITKYEVQAFDADGNLVGFNNNCPVATPQRCTVEGLVEGTSYTLKARAFHSAGFGSLSAASAAFAPVGNPDAVRQLSAVAGNQTLTISWLAPLYLGGATFVRYDVYVKLSTDQSFPAPPAPYQITCSPSATACDGQYTFTGMTNGASYDVKVVTITSIDNSEIVSNTALVSQVPYTTPTAVRSLDAVEVGTDLLITWGYPSFDGGKPITSYSIDINAGALSCQSTGDLYCSVPMGQVSEFDIDAVALNVAGQSPVSNYVFQLLGAQNNIQGGGGGGGSGGIGSVVPGISAPNLVKYSSTIVAGVPTTLELLGSNLNLINKAMIGPSELQFEILSNEKIRVLIPARSVGSLMLELHYSGGKLEKQLLVKPRVSSRVNSGSFNGAIAVYAYGYAGQRLSARIDNEWIVINRLASNFVRLTRPSAGTQPVRVKIYVNRKLVRTMSVLPRF